MAVILAQPDFLHGFLASTAEAPRIPAMRKKGTAYLRTVRAPVAAEDVPHNLRKWREYKGWSQEIVAEKSSLSVSAISNFERGEDDPSLDSLGKLSKAFGVPRGMLLDVGPNEDPPLWASVLRATVAPKK